MRITFLLIAFILCMSSFCIIMKDETILWQKNRLLTWKDYKGKPAKRFAAASTFYNIVKTISKTNETSSKVTIEALFFCEKSWMKKSWVNNSVLEHEQKHFDIVEIFSRKLRKIIIENKGL